MSAAVIVLFDPSSPPYNERRCRGRLPKSVGNLHRYRMVAVLKAQDVAEEQRQTEVLRQLIAFHQKHVDELRFELAQRLSRDLRLNSQKRARVAIEVLS